MFIFFETLESLLGCCFFHQHEPLATAGYNRSPFLRADLLFYTVMHFIANLLLMSHRDWDDLSVEVANSIFHLTVCNYIYTVLYICTYAAQVNTSVGG